MKRLFSILIMLAAVASAALAQKNLKINQAFDGRYRDNPNVQEVYITGSQLRGYGLDIYHSLTLADMPKEAASIVKMVVADGKKAIDKEVVYRDGGLYYGFYQLPGTETRRRYIFYLNQSFARGSKIILVYMEGVASPQAVLRMLQ